MARILNDLEYSKTEKNGHPPFKFLTPLEFRTDPHYSRDSSPHFILIAFNVLDTWLTCFVIFGHNLQLYKVEFDCSIY